MDSTPRPATRPAWNTRPGAAARTGSPGAAARSTPRWPAPYADSGGSQPRSTVGREPTGHARPSAVPAAAPVTEARARAGAGSASTRIGTSTRIGRRTSTSVGASRRTVPGKRRGGWRRAGRAAAVRSVVMRSPCRVTPGPH
ncbi:hypothetical protein [Streptomyces hebeiensis]